MIHIPVNLKTFVELQKYVQHAFTDTNERSYVSETYRRANQTVEHNGSDLQVWCTGMQLGSFMYWLITPNPPDAFYYNGDPPPNGLITDALNMGLVQIF